MLGIGAHIWYDDHLGILGHLRELLQTRTPGGRAPPRGARHGRGDTHVSSRKEHARAAYQHHCVCRWWQADAHPHVSLCEALHHRILPSRLRYRHRNRAEAVRRRLRRHSSAGRIGLGEKFDLVCLSRRAQPNALGLPLRLVDCPLALALAHAEMRASRKSQAWWRARQRRRNAGERSGEAETEREQTRCAWCQWRIV